MKKYTDAQRTIDYKVVFGSPTGKKVLADILAAGHVYSPLPMGDLLAVGIGMGENNMAKRIAAYVGYGPQDFVSNAMQLKETLEND